MTTPADEIGTPPRHKHTWRLLAVRGHNFRKDILKGFRDEDRIERCEDCMACRRSCLPGSDLLTPLWERLMVGQGSAPVLMPLPTDYGEIIAQEAAGLIATCWSCVWWSEDDDGDGLGCCAIRLNAMSHRSWRTTPGFSCLEWESGAKR